VKLNLLNAIKELNPLLAKPDDHPVLSGYEGDWDDDSYNLATINKRQMN
jgi:hypothetical protein